MDAEEFRRRGKEMIDYVADYLEKDILNYPPLSQVQPGYLRAELPDHAPEDPQSFDDVMKDVNRVIMPGITHWHNPHFHAYYPTATSYAGICGDLLSDAIGCIGFSWAASPACTELEQLMMDWLGKLLHLPDEFLSTGGKGGGVIQGTASEATLVTLLAARSKAINQYKKDQPELSDTEILGKLVTYTSEQAHSSVERACLLGTVRCHLVSVDDKDEMKGESLATAIREDREKGLIPFYVVATLGTTPSCSFDQLQEIGPVCRAEDLWLHIDAAYAGSSFICPEFRPLLDGVELADSFNFNPHKWLLVNFDCSALWFKDSTHLVDAFNVDPLYLKHQHQGAVPDYRHWQIPLGRRFRALKLWFVMRLYGVKGLQAHIRRHVDLAHKFEEMVRKDNRFEVTHKVTLGLVCFKLKGMSNEVNEELLSRINKDTRIHMVPSKSASGVYHLRMAVCASRTELSDIEFAWNVVKELASKLLAETCADRN